MSGGKKAEGSCDASDLRRALELWQSEAGGLAPLGLSLDSTVHRLNNPLAALLVLLEGLCEQMLKVVPSEEQLEALRMVQEARLQGARLADGVRELASLRPDDPPASTDVGAVLGELATRLERRAQGGLRVRAALGEELCIYTRPLKLAQLLWTAAQVAVDLDGGPERAEGEPEGGSRELSIAGARAGDSISIVLSRSDLASARGGQTAFQDRRFDLLAATVHQLGGALQAVDHSLCLSFPVSAAVFDSEAQADVKLMRRCSVPPRGEMRLLVVDDDPGIFGALRRGFRDLGDVQTVTSAAAAQELLSGGAMFDVILSDLIMPESSGLELARWLSVHRPRLRRRLILMTGMGEPALDHDPDTIAVTKPFDMEALRELVCEVAARG